MNNTRTYSTNDSIIFSKTTAPFGGLSNMAAGFSININDIIIPTAEHLYQACRFPDYPQLQLDIINEPSPMTAKQIGRNNIACTRNDWEQIRFKVMQWVLEVKLSQNWETFSGLLLETGNKNIVELTPTNKVWGAVKNGDILTGVNALGRLLMLMRERYAKTNNYQRCVPPLEVDNFMLLGYPIEMVCNEDYEAEIRWSLSEEYSLS